MKDKKTGVRFGILYSDLLAKYQTQYLESNNIDYKSSILSLIKSKPQTRIIPFEKFSGLTMKEVVELIRSNLVVFCTYSSIYDDNNVYPSKPGTKICSETQLVADKSNEEDTIDSVITDNLRIQYPHLNNYFAENAKVFVKRYIADEESDVDLILR